MFPVGEPYHSPGLLRQQLPRVTNQKTPPKPCSVYFRHVTRNSPPEFAQARRDSRGLTPRPAVREPGVTTPPGLRPHGKTAEAPYSKLGGAAASQANGPALAGWWKRSIPDRLRPRAPRPSRAFPVGELFHSPGLPRQRLPGVRPTKTPEACRASLDRRTRHGLRRQHPMCNRRTPLDSLARDRPNVAPLQCPRGKSPHNESGHLSHSPACFSRLCVVAVSYAQSLVIMNYWCSFFSFEAGRHFFLATNSESSVLWKKIMP
jgi:hypothetical protein